MGNKDKKVQAPKVGAKNQQPQVSRVQNRRQGTTPATNSNKVFIAKLGESQIAVDYQSGDTVLSVLTRAEFPEGVFKTANGTSITNLIKAAKAEMESGRATSIAACFSDLRVNAALASLETPLQGGAILTLIPKITGG